MPQAVTKRSLPRAFELMRACRRNGGALRGVGVGVVHANALPYCAAIREAPDALGSETALPPARQMRSSSRSSS